MTGINGKSRVIITNVCPVINGGAYTAKATINEELPIIADAFCDGHDEIFCSVFIKHGKDRQWKEYPMTFKNNDRWEYLLLPDKLGIYRFRVQAGVDAFATWKNGLLKKHGAGQDVSVELLIGAELLTAAVERANAKDKSLLRKWSKEITNTEESALLIPFITSDEVSAVMRRNASKENITEYPGVYEIEAERKRAGFSTWYELFPRSAASEAGRHGTFADVQRLLPHIADMGFDVLYLPPIHPIGELKRKGKNNSLTAGPDEPGSPWAVGSRFGGHKAIHPELGSLNDFKRMCTEAKKHGIEVALDIAFQCAPDHPYVKEHPQWFKWRPDGTVQYAENPPKKYEDILPLNFETEDWENLWAELQSVVEYWIKAGVTIFRVDNPHTKSLYFWEHMIGNVRKKYPETIFLAEAFTRPRIMEQLAKAGFNQSYTYFTWRNTKAELEEYLTELTKTDMRYYYRPNFWPNTPDILPPILTHGGENAHIMRLILAGTLSANYGLYGPVYEYGLNVPVSGKEEYVDNEKYEIRHWDWTEYTRIKEFIARLNRIRKTHPALQSTYNISFATTTNDQVICYVKRDRESGDTLIIAVNLDPHHTQSAWVDIPGALLGIPESGSYRVTDLLSGDSYTWQDVNNYVELNPFDIPAHILKVEQA